jgi:hypothetical protein
MFRRGATSVALSTVITVCFLLGFYLLCIVNVYTKIMITRLQAIYSGFQVFLYSALLLYSL